MNSQTIHASQVDFEANSAQGPIRGLLHLLSALGRAFQDARQIEKQARQLYATGDAELAEAGLSREQIAPRLMKLYRD